ncbi:MAG TPA: hypothetical protein VHG34_01845, partial [Nitrososphaeraceae archaeon]|nr:hypothetical protein [Nitrososphaeraceae archaeon]
YEANLPWHRSHDIASRFFMISEIGWTFGTVVLDCNPDAVSFTNNRLAHMHKFTFSVFYIGVNKPYRLHPYSPLCNNKLRSKCKSSA